LGVVARAANSRHSADLCALRHAAAAQPKVELPVSSFFIKRRPSTVPGPGEASARAPSLWAHNLFDLSTGGSGRMRRAVRVLSLAIPGDE